MEAYADVGTRPHGGWEQPLARAGLVAKGASYAIVGILALKLALGDGGKATSLSIMTRLDNDSFKWESVNRDIDGELQPNVEPVLVVRKVD